MGTLTLAEANGISKGAFLLTFTDITKPTTYCVRKFVPYCSTCVPFVPLWVERNKIGFKREVRLEFE